MSLDTAWLCGDCRYVNTPAFRNCANCYSTNRVRLQPVKHANKQQNTPSYAELAAAIAGEESARSSDIPFGVQQRALIDAYFQELARPAGDTAENPQESDHE
jgi:hypothetical protein